MAQGKQYIDKELLKGLADSIVEKVLDYIGKDLQKGIQSMLKKAKKSQPHSKPGEPPKTLSSNSPLKNLINYGIDKENMSVVSGPMIFEDSKNKGDSPVPHILEKGGDTRTEISEFYNVVKRNFLGRDHYFKSRRRALKALKSEGFRAWRREWRRNHQNRLEKIIHIAPRPFVQPVFDLYLRGDGVKRAIMRAKGQTATKGYDSKWAWTDVKKKFGLTNKK